MERRRLATTDRTDGSAGPALLSVRRISKVFPGQVALDSVGLDLQAGEIRGLVGQNGSGKSTLIKILAGYHSPEPGAEGWVSGKPFRFGSAEAAAAAGLRFIHQDLGLIDGLSLMDNLALGTDYGQRGPWVSVRRSAAMARRQLDAVGLDLDPRQRLASCTAVERTMVALARALFAGGTTPAASRVLVLDEPTVALSRPDVERLFATVRQVAAQGTAILYVSHNLEEVLELTSGVTVLRDGRVAAEASTASLAYGDLVKLVVGEQLMPAAEREARRRGDVLLAVDGLSGETVHELSFEVREGEVVGLAGLDDSGRSELAYMLGGARPWFGGEVTLGGTPVKRLDPRRAIELGIAFVASDRAQESAVPRLAARENVTLSLPAQSGPLGWVSARGERSDARRWMSQLNVVPCEPDRLFALFSGGNQQKIVLARALRAGPRLLVVDQPVQGVDIGSKALIYRQLLEIAASGVSVVVASSDPEDLAAVCDRILVLRRGEIALELSDEKLDVPTITHATLGGDNGSHDQPIEAHLDEQFHDQAHLGDAPGTD